ALDLCNEVTVDTEAEPGVSWEGEGADELPTDGTDMVSRAIALAFARSARVSEPPPVPPVGLHGVNRIPPARGLGSSAAAALAGTVAGLVLSADGEAAHLRRDLSPLVAYVRLIEGHADNAAAAVLGGLTVVASGYPYRIDPHSDVDPVVLLPERATTSTAAARAALSETVARRDAVFNIGHASLAVIALTRDPTVLSFALQDRLHEDARLASAPDGLHLLRGLRSRKIAACVSGSGPSLLVFPLDERDLGDLPDGWRAIRPGIRQRGVEFDVER
ncbi:MAG: homoserine kinase, partial [Gemmatimonadota bacterium]